MEKRHKRRLRLFLGIAVALSASVLLALSFSTMDGSTRRVVSGIDVASFIIVLALVSGRWIAECFRFRLIIAGIGRRMPFRNVAKSVLGSAFAGTLTPYKAGTVPTQAFFLSQYGLTGGEATAVATTGAAFSMILLTMSVPVVLLVTASQIRVGLGIRTMLVAGGVAGLFLFLFAVYSARDPGAAARVAGRLVPGRLRKRTGFRRFQERLAGGMEDFSSSLRRLLRGPRRTLVSIAALTMVFWFAEVMVAPLILRGLGLGKYFWQAMLAELVIAAVLPFAPVPGESGVAEAAFAGIFIAFIPRNAVALVTVAWRFLEFYVPMLGLGLVFILAMKDVARRKRSEAPAPAPAPSRPDTVPG